MLSKVYAFLLFHMTKTATSNSKLYTTKYIITVQILNDKIAGLWLYNPSTPRTKQILAVGYLIQTWMQSKALLC